MLRIFKLYPLTLIFVLACNLTRISTPSSSQMPSLPTATHAVDHHPTTMSPCQPQVTLTLGGMTNEKIHPLLGVNIGPVPAGKDPANADLTNAYRQIGVTLIRTHDFYGPLDMAVMYPDRRRDPVNPQSYDFHASDKIWQAIVDGGFEPYFRLGDSWNNSKPPVNAQERANWVRAAVEVVRHYHQGQWNGFAMSFRYIEIWNEPDNRQFWPPPHTLLEYFQLYVETAQALKQVFPDLLVGGPGVTQAGVFAPQGQKWTRDFLAYVRKNDAPLDFFSWHIYSNDPNDWIRAAQFYRSELDTLGFQATAMHLTEWNTDIRQPETDRKEMLALRTGGKGAAILTAAWIAMQQNGIAVSTFYRGSDPSMDAVEFYGLFYANGNPKRNALAFQLWSRLAAHPQRVIVSAAPETELWILAGQDASGEIALLLANPMDTSVCYAVAGLEGRQLDLLQVNDESDQIQSQALDGNTAEIGGYTVQLITGRAR